MPLPVTVRTVKSFFLSFILFASTLSNAHARDHAAGEVEFATKTNAKTVKAGATFEVELKYKQTLQQV